MIRVVWGRCATDTVVPLGGRATKSRQFSREHIK